MRRLTLFSQLTLNGYFAGADGDISWARRGESDAEWDEYVRANARGGGTLLFGRVTYELMARYWPTPMAMKNDPVVAERMNSGSKIVFSRTLDKASWQNTRLIKGDLVDEVRKLKAETGDPMAILGSGSIAAQLAEHGLIDEFQFVINPAALGKGRTLFEGIGEKLDLTLKRSRVFTNGNVLLCYAPAGP